MAKDNAKFTIHNAQRKYIEAVKTADIISEKLNIPLGDLVDVFAEIPTADVVEVKHSRWKKISGFDVCNICGTSPAYWEPKPNNPKGYPPYCHNCGAKMRGDAE